MNKINFLFIVSSLAFWSIGCKPSEKVTSSAAGNIPAKISPEFPGSDEGLEKYFEKAWGSLIIPETHQLIVQVLIGPDGKVKTAELTEGFKLRHIKTTYKTETVPEGLKLTRIESEIKEATPAEIEAAVIKAALNMPKWKPAVQNGKLIEAKTTFPIWVVAEDQKETYRKDKNTILEGAGMFPKFPGGIQEFMNYLKAAVRSGQENPLEKPEGMVVVKFVVNRFGRVKDPEIVKSLNPEVDALIKKAVSESPQWQPGKQNGLPVNIYYICPVRFTLTD